MRPAEVRTAFEALADELTPVHTPIGDAWILASDEARFLAQPGPPALARLLPSGDAYFLLWGADRTLLVQEAKRRDDTRVARRVARRWGNRRGVAPIGGRCLD